MLTQNLMVLVMNDKIKKIYDKFDALEQREKIMISGLLLVLFYITWQILLFDEATISNDKLNIKIKNQQQQNSTIQSEISAYKQRLLTNPNIKLTKEKTVYIQKIAILDDKLNKKMKGLINPKKMTLILKDIFKSNKKLTLLSLNKLKAESMFDFSENDTQVNSSDNSNKINITDDVGEQGVESEKSLAVVYRHPVTIVFSGSYLNAMSYLESIEKMPWDLYWESVKLNVEKYPKSIIEITVFTLSLKKGWLGV